MKIAKSMYLGGVLINSSEADHNSCKELGLVCPLCSEAVFLVSSSYRVNKLRNGKIKEQFVSASFSHYKSSDPFLDCDNRVKTKLGKERLKQIEIEGRNQRLKLYNKHLWEMFKDDRNIERKHLLYNKKFIGKPFLERMAIACRKYVADNLEEIYQKAEDFKMFVDYYSSEDFKKEALNTSSLTQIYGLGDFEKQCDYFKHKCDMRLHFVICNEIIDFLSTRTSGYFWLNLLAIVMSLYATELQLKDKKIIQNAMSDIKELVSVSIALMRATHWIERVNERLNFDTMK